MQDIDEKIMKGKADFAHPLVSVITVVLNGASHLEQAIKSVLGQTYGNIQYIIIDGGSTDGTLDIIRNYESQLAFWTSEKDSGIYDAMNRGILKAEGELIGILNSDDWYEPDAVEIIVNQYRVRRSEGVYYGLLRVWDGDRIQSIQGNTDLVLDKFNIAHPTCFIGKNIYKQHGVFDLTYRISGDYELMLRLRKNRVPFIFIERILANFRLGGASRKQDRRRVFEKLEIQRKYGIISGSHFILKKLLSIGQASFSRIS